MNNVSEVKTKGQAVQGRHLCPRYKENKPQQAASQAHVTVQPGWRPAAGDAAQGQQQEEGCGSEDRGPLPWKGRQEGLKRGLHVYSRSGWAGVLWLAEWHLWAGGSHLLLAAAQTHGMTSGPWAPAQQPLPARPPPIV